MDLTKDLNVIAHYLARRDVPELSAEYITNKLDLIVLLGSSLIDPIHVAARAMKLGLGKHLLVSGGIGHSTQHLYHTVSAHPTYGEVATKDRAEADVIRDILIEYLGVKEELITIENQSTNCGSNAEESRRLVDKLLLPSDSLLLIQDPTMQRRTHACFERFWSDRLSAQIVSFSPFVPVVTEGDNEIRGSDEKAWPFDRFVSLVLGEIPRLRDDKNGYGPKGRNFIDHIEIPKEVISAHKRLQKYYSALERNPY